VEQENWQTELIKTWKQKCSSKPIERGGRGLPALLKNAVTVSNGTKLHEIMNWVGSDRGQIRGTIPEFARKYAEKEIKINLSIT
jgi:hypothetical protein